VIHSTRPTLPSPSLASQYAPQYAASNLTIMPSLDIIRSETFHPLYALLPVQLRKGIVTTYYSTTIQALVFPAARLDLAVVAEDPYSHPTISLYPVLFLLPSLL
jgi:hypothetical protein